MVETFGTSYYAGSRIKILRSGATGQWAITEKNADRGNIKTLTTYGTKRMNAYQILEQTLNQRDVRVFDYVEDENGNKKPVLNKKETAIAQDRQELIKQKFSEWIWKDIDRRERLCRIYNETFNSIRPREYDGSHICFSGMNPEITLRPHQVNAIAHIMYGGNTLLAHEVGAGKTFEMVAAAMEMKRLGLCTKSLIVVPNHITEQWAAEWLQLYPSANILVATKRTLKHRTARNSAPVSLPATMTQLSSVTRSLRKSPCRQNGRLPSYSSRSTRSCSALRKPSLPKRNGTRSSSWNAPEITGGEAGTAQRSEPQGRPCDL